MKMKKIMASNFSFFFKKKEKRKKKIKRERVFK